MIEWIKTHKIWVIGGIVALIFFVYVLRSGGSTSGTSTYGGAGSDVAAATALQNAQLQAASQNAQISAAAGAQSEQTAAQLELGKLQIAQAGAHDQLAAQVATSNINATQQLQSLLGSLSADVSRTSINADVSKTSILATNQTEQQRILADALVSQSQTQAQIAQAGYSAQTEIASHRGGLFGGGGFLGLGF